MHRLSRFHPAWIAGVALLVLGAADPVRAQAYRSAVPVPPLALPLALPGATLVQYGGGAPGGYADIGAAVYDAVTEASAFCAALSDATYQIDCLAERLDAIYRAMPDNSPYDDTKAALKSAAEELAAVVEANRDRARAGTSFATASGSTRTSRRLRPVAEANRAGAVSRAVAIIAETETVLLRSSASAIAGEASPQIARIAAAVGSNKALLRSA